MEAPIKLGEVIEGYGGNGMSMLIPVDRDYEYWWNRADEGQLAQIRYTAHSDYSGSEVEHVNCKTIMEEHPEIVRSLYIDFGGELLYINLDQVLETNDEIDTAMDFLYMLEQLEKSPVHNEDALWDYEQELIVDAISDWAFFSAPDDLKKMYPDRSDLEAVAHVAISNYDADGTMALIEEPHSAYIDEDKLEAAIRTMLDEMPEELKKMQLAPATIL